MTKYIQPVALIVIVSADIEKKFCEAKFPLKNLWPRNQGFSYIAKAGQVSSSYFELWPIYSNRSNILYRAWAVCSGFSSKIELANHQEKLTLYLWSRLKNKNILNLRKFFFATDHKLTCNTTSFARKTIFIIIPKTNQLKVIERWRWCRKNFR